MRRFFLASTLCAAVLALAACPAPEPRPTYPDITFTGKPPLVFNVAEIKVDVPYVEPLEPPHVGENFPVPPLRAARNWAEQRFRAGGGRGSVTVTIIEAGAVEIELERSGGLKGLLTKEQAQRYEVTLAVRVLAVDPVGPRSVHADARVTRNITVPENADLNEREATQYKLTQDAMADLDAVMEQQIRRHLAGFLR